MPKKTRKQVCGFGTVTNTGDGIVGSFTAFNEMLLHNGFGGKRVLICYQEVTPEEEQELMEERGEAWCEKRTES